MQGCEFNSRELQLQAVSDSWPAGFDLAGLCPSPSSSTHLEDSLDWHAGQLLAELQATDS